MLSVKRSKAVKIRNANTGKGELFYMLREVKLKVGKCYVNQAYIIIDQTVPSPAVQITWKSNETYNILHKCVTTCKVGKHFRFRVYCKKYII